MTPSASQDDINKAYRKKSRSLHPDKVKQQLRAEKAQADKKKGAGGGSAASSSKGPTQAEIRKAVKEASERQARLSLIANILRGPARDRYDHFLANGFPLWKGTDYYYNRYRPGLGTVLVGVFMMGGGAIHYLALYMSWKRQREFVERYVTFARNAAWGNDAGIPGVDAMPAPAPAPAPEEDEAAAPAQPRNRRERRMQEKETRKDDGKSSKKARKAVTSKSSSSAPTPTGARKRVVAENGKILVVDSQGDVFLEEEDEEGNVNEFLLDVSIRKAILIQGETPLLTHTFPHSRTSFFSLLSRTPPWSECPSGSSDRPLAVSCPRALRRPRPRRPMRRTRMPRKTRPRAPNLPAMTLRFWTRAQIR